MRISDWSSDVCSSDLTWWQRRLARKGAPTFYRGSRGKDQAVRDRPRQSPGRHRRVAAPRHNPIHIGPSSSCPLDRSEEHTSELQSLMRISYAVFCLKKKKNTKIEV